MDGDRRNRTTGIALADENGPSFEAGVAISGATIGLGGISEGG